MIQPPAVARPNGIPVVDCEPMQAAYGSRPGHPVLRAAGAGALVVFVALFGLVFFPSLLLVLMFVLAPAAAAFVFAGPPIDKDTFVANSIVASLASGLTGAAWLGARADDSTETAAVGVGAFVSFILLVMFAGLACFLLGRLLVRDLEQSERADLLDRVRRRDNADD